MADIKVFYTKKPETSKWLSWLDSDKYSMRKNNVLSELPWELFIRLVGLYYSIPGETRESKKYRDISESFEHLEHEIYLRIENDDNEQFRKNDLGDNVHNLNLLLIGVIQLGYLETNIHSVREEYKGHVDDNTYKEFTNSCMHKYLLEKACTSLNENDKEEYEEKLRLEYRNLTNEIRRARLYEAHIEQTRLYLMRKLRNAYLITILLPLLNLIWYPLTTKGLLSLETNTYKSFVILSLAAIAGATGSLISMLGRIQGVNDNNKLAQNITTFNFSTSATKTVPLTGFVFAIILCFMFAADLVSGTLFPKGDLPKILDTSAQLSKLLIWCFISGFSERFVPDIIDRLAEKAKKGEKT